MKLYEHLLCALDLTTHCLSIADKANQLANNFGAHLSLMHVVDTIPSYAEGYFGVSDVAQDLADEAQKELLSIGKELMIPEDDHYIVTGSAKTMIMDVAEKVKADLIVVGSHGQHGLHHLLGTTASAIVHHAKCDVITLRLDD